MIAAAWRELDHNRTMAEAAAEQLSPAALTRAHEAAHRRLGELVQRGREDGSFRTDVPAGWLATSCFALMHACRDEVRAGRIEAAAALDVLTITIRDVFMPPRRDRP